MNIWNNSSTDSHPKHAVSGNGTVLLVDDEPLVRVMTGAVLTAMGWSVINVSSGEEAVQTLKLMRERGASVDLVILDLILPSGISGLDTVRLLREIQPGVRILACSGFFGDEMGSSCLDLGFNATLSKPFTAEDLAQAVYKCTHTLESSKAPAGASA
ncbi:MAG TPA: response regulator [Verrucomicrobiaceae bacterium]|jgi:CheY-like chemotaxis protein